MSKNNLPSNQIRLLTAKEVAEQLGIKEDTLQAWRSNKRYNLPYVKIGRYVRYNPEAVVKFIQERTIDVNKISTTMPKLPPKFKL
ncbi:MAG: helix-turn-helix domain-containing protein [Gammaproteobacteria bacterium]|jgi:excisionase family DNA binding protein